MGILSFPAGTPRHTVMKRDRPFEDSLTESEAQNVAAYRRRQSAPGCCFMLSQSGERSFAAFSTPTILHTLIANPSLNFSDDVHRWLTPSECLMYQCFPLTPYLGNPQGFSRQCCSFSSHPDHPRNRRAVMRQAGNSMNIPCVSAMTLFALMFVLTEADGHPAF